MRCFDSPASRIKPLRPPCSSTLLDELLSLADGPAPRPRAVRDLAAARARVAEDRFNLVVLGEFKRGKSTLINALLGRERPADRRRSADLGRDRDRRRRPRPAAWSATAMAVEEERPLAELAEYVTEARQPGQRPAASSSHASSLTTSCCVAGSSSSTPRGRLDPQPQHRRRSRASSLGSTRRFACSMPGSRCLRPSASCCRDGLLDAPAAADRRSTRSITSTAADRDAAVRVRPLRASRPARPDAEIELFAVSARRRRRARTLAAGATAATRRRRARVAAAAVGGRLARERRRGHRAGGAVRGARDPVAAR